MSEKVAPARVMEKGAQGGALAKLLVFSISLALVPISSYFLSSKYLWEDNSTYSAITAVVSANVVLVTYIIASVLEDKGDQAAISPVKTTEAESRKTR